MPLVLGCCYLVLRVGAGMPEGFSQAFLLPFQFVAISVSLHHRGVCVGVCSCFIPRSILLLLVIARLIVGAEEFFLFSLSLHDFRHALCAWASGIARS